MIDVSWAGYPGHNQEFSMSCSAKLYTIFRSNIANLTVIASLNSLVTRNAVKITLKGAAGRLVNLSTTFQATDLSLSSPVLAHVATQFPRIR